MFVNVFHCAFCVDIYKKGQTQSNILYPKKKNCWFMIKLTYNTEYTNDSTPEAKTSFLPSPLQVLHLCSLIHTTTYINHILLFLVFVFYTYSSISDLAGNLLKKLAGTEGILLLNRGWRSMNRPIMIAITWNGVT